MDRGKMSSTGRGGKSKAPQHPQDIFALGSKSTVVVSRDSEKRNIHKPTTSGVERKREATTSFGSQPPGKRSRIGSPAESVSGTSLEVDPVDLVPHVLQALDTHNSDKLLGLLTGSIRLLKSQRSKPDPILCMSMLYLVKIRPNMFAHETVTQSLCSLLKREQGAGFKSKGNPLVFVLACNMLYAGHKDNRNWPDTFIKVYIEDALNERWWVECAWCRCLVENIVTAFNTKLPPASLIPTDNTLGTMSPSGSGSPLMGSTDDDVDVAELEYSVFPRYSSSYETVEGLVLEAIKEQLQRRAAPDAIGKGFLKLLAATCGFPEIRMISASRLEAWLHSGKLWRAAQELLAHVCVNADAGAGGGGGGARDHEVLAQLARMRLKTKPLQQAYITCLKEMVSGGGAVLRGVVTHTIYNELSNVRSANNLAVLAALLQAQPTAAPRAMSDSYLELLMRPDEYLRPLRALTRECVRGARGDAGALLPLCRALAQPPPHEPAAEVRERAFSSIADLFCLCCLIVASHRAHVPDYKQTISQIQAAAMGWLLDVAVPIYKPARHDYLLALNKIMFVEPAETYSKLDNWPPESERALTHRLCSEAPLPQPTLLRLVFIGLHKEIPISAAESLELLETLVRRACALPPEQRPLSLDAPDQLPDYLFQLAQFQPADSVQLPPGYTVPPLAISALYWRCWSALVMLCAHSPGVAHAAAQRYPTLRALIDAAITDKPSIEWSAHTAAEAEAERAAILQLESHLAAASHSKLPVTEQNCRLLSQLTTLDPLGPARKPPAGVLEAFQQQAAALRLGALLCRQPALLLELVQRHGTRRAMPWLHTLMQQEQLQLSVLPVQCLCEFLSAGGAWSGAARAEQLAAHLRRTIADSSDGALAVLQYYTQRLSHHHASTRASANRGLKLVLTQAPDDGSEVDYNADVDPMEWISALWSLPHWEAVRGAVVAHVLVACLAECRARAVAAYVALLARHVHDQPHQDHNNIVLGMSQLIMERGTIVNSMLPAPPDAPPAAAAAAQHETLLHLTSIFYYHLNKVRVRDDTDPAEAEAEAEGADGALAVRWPGWRADMHTTQAHAHLKLLCYGPSNLDTEQHMYKWLEATWSEAAGPAALLPDWLRLHLVRCARPTLLALGLRAVSPMKLALFIQTFGVPVPAVTALLQALDGCPAAAVARLGVERAYMSLLLRVQRGRGARGGQAFAAAARLAPAEPIPEDTLFSSPPVPAETSSPWSRAPPPRAPSPPPTVTSPGFGQESPLQFTTMLSKISSEVGRADTPYTTSVVRALLAHVSAGARAPLSPLLLRALLPHTHTHAAMLLQISETLLKQYKCAVGPLVNILREMRQLAGGASASETEDDLPPIPSHADKHTLVRALESSTARTLEAVGERIIRTQRTQLVVDVLSAALENNMAARYDVEIKQEAGSAGAPAHVLSRRGRGCGLLLDWLAELQAETLGPQPERQMRLMFRAGSAAWRPLLATQLAHRASWRTLHTCLTTLLHDTDGWAPPLVLQFAATLVRSPRVWQGRDKAAAKHHASPELLQLSHQQLCVLVRYILEEGDAAYAQGGYEATCRSISARLPLLLQCCRGDSALLCAAATAPTTPAASVALLLLYMKVPKILQLVSSCHERPTRVSLRPPAELQRAAAAFPCATDAVSHCLLCAQTPPDNAPKDHTHKMYRLEGGVRALWARHPRAAARAVPLVAALLRGAAPRAPALTHLLAALEMVPDDALFSDEHTKELSDIVECLMSYAACTSGGALLHRAAALLRRLAARGGAGSGLLHQHRHTAASVPALSGLVAAGGGEGAPSSAAPPPHALLALQRRRDSPDELQYALQEIEQWGTRRGGAWGGAGVARALLAAAAPLLAAPHAGTRKAAASLLVKLLPAVDDTTPALHAMLECLESGRAELAQGVLERLGELLGGAQEQAARVLARVFALGVRGRVPADAAVAKCVATINLLRGC